jgi:PHP family Zn ribbon phosphoesterase
MSLFPDYTKIAKEIGLPVPSYADDSFEQMQMKNLDTIIKCYKSNTGHGESYAKNNCHRGKYPDTITKMCHSVFRLYDSDKDEYKCTRFRRALRKIARN